MKILIKVENLSKSFVRRSGPRKWGQVLSFRRKSAPPETLWALRNISFEVGAGEMLGVVGANGAGKSTLLRMLGGIGQPTSGTLEIRGKLGALLDLGGGFQPDLSGRENAIMATVVAGLTKEEALSRLPDIIRFSELEKFIDDPVRTYSSGMGMRLAFAAAVHADPEIMLVDEFLSVGDLAFQAKCLARVTEMRQNGCAIVLVSQGMDQVRKLCGRALWLRGGQVEAFDSAEVVAEAYEKAMREETLRRTPTTVAAGAVAEGACLPDGGYRIGSREIEITEVHLRPGRVINSGGPLSVDIHYRSPRPLASPNFVVSISTPSGMVCVDMSTRARRVVVPAITGDGQIRLIFDRLDLAKGSYYVDVSVFEPNMSHAYDSHYHLYPLMVEGGVAQKGVMAPPCTWSMERVEEPPAEVVSPAEKSLAGKGVSLAHSHPTRK